MRIRRNGTSAVELPHGKNTGEMKEEAPAALSRSKSLFYIMIKYAATPLPFAIEWFKAKIYIEPLFDLRRRKNKL